MKQYIVIQNVKLEQVITDVILSRMKGYITCGGLCVTLALSGVITYYQAMELPYESIAFVEETKEMKIEGMGISFIGKFKDEPKGNTWYGLPSDLNQYLNQSYCTIRRTIDHLTPDKDYKVTITFEEVKK